MTDDKRIMHYEEPDQVPEARTLYDNVLKENSNSKIFLTGHSLGGALAQHIAREKNCSAITFNAPGINKVTTDQDNNDSKTKTQGSGRVVNFVNLNDYIGCYGEHVGETRYYLSKGKSNITPHSNYVAQDFSLYDALPKDIKWSEADASTLLKCDPSYKITSIYSDISKLISGKTPIGYVERKLQECHRQKQHMFATTDLEYKDKLFSRKIYIDIKDDTLQAPTVKKSKEKNENSSEDNLKQERLTSSQIFSNSIRKMAQRSYLATNNLYPNTQPTASELFSNKLKQSILAHQQDKNQLFNANYRKHHSPYNTNKNGHWVTIDGNHVFIEA